MFDSEPYTDRTFNLNLLECPVCKEYMVPPYLQCAEGHIQTSVIDLLESVVEPHLISCQFEGCKKKFFKTESRVEHQASCDLKHMKCPNGRGCKWRGSFTDVVQHMLAEHEWRVVNGHVVNHAYKRPHPNNFVGFQRCFDYDFLLTLTHTVKDSWNRFYFIVQLLGTRKDAKKFNYSATLVNESTKIVCESDMNSILEDMNELMSNEDCFSFSDKQAAKFTKDGEMNISLEIKQK